MKKISRADAYRLLGVAPAERYDLTKVSFTAALMRQLAGLARKGTKALGSRAGRMGADTLGGKAAIMGGKGLGKVRRGLEWAAESPLRAAGVGAGATVLGSGAAGAAGGAMFGGRQQPQQPRY